MKYQITCANCNKRFLVEGKGGQTIECTCPGCGGKMRVDLPKSKKGGSDDEEDPNEIYQQGYVPGDNGNTAMAMMTTAAKASAAAPWHWDVRSSLSWRQQP